MNRIREIREGLRQRSTAYTQEAVARRVGVTERTYRRWEVGSSDPTPRHARRLAADFGVDLKELGLED